MDYRTIDCNNKNCRHNMQILLLMLATPSVSCEQYIKLWTTYYNNKDCNNKSNVIRNYTDSCVDAGYTQCCVSGERNCEGSFPATCFCDAVCQAFQDCCSDLETICNSGTYV